MGQGSSNGQAASVSSRKSCCRDASDTSMPDRQSDTVKVNLATSPKATCCKPRAAEGDAQPDPACDTVFAERVSCEDSENLVVPVTSSSSSSAFKPLLQRPRAFDNSSSSFGCGLGSAPGPAVEVASIAAHSATVSWTYPSGADRKVRKWHIEVIDGIEEMAFLEAPGDTSSLELPLDILRRAHGPYCVQVAAESGPEGDAAKFSLPGVSRTFWTPLEDPGPVIWPRLSEAASETRLRVEWDAPMDDGGSPIKEYKVVLYKEASTLEARISECAETADYSLAKSSAWSAVPTSIIDTWATKKTRHVIECLSPGSSYRVEVRAISIAELVGFPASLVARCALSAPMPPTALRAQLQPRLPSSGGPTETVRVEFCAPRYDGGQQLEFFRVSAVENDDPVLEAKSPRLRVVSEVPFADAAATLGHCPPLPGGRCACDVQVLPNSTYSFVVQASNGDCLGVASDATSAVFVPARVPSPPALAAEVYTQQGGIAELVWESPEMGGGLPVTSFKVGIMRCASVGEASSIIIREVTIPRASALAHVRAAHGVVDNDEDEGLPLIVQCDDEEVLLAWGTRIDGLEADTRYRFVIATSNGLGTGCWSAPSALVSTPVAAPAAPANPVATVALDSQRRTAVTVVWESGLSRVGCGTIVAFHLALTLQQVHDSGQKAFGGKAHDAKEEWQCGKVLYDRLLVQDSSNCQRMTWTKPLLRPGRYRVELTSENTMGQRSAPAVLALNVSPEAFAPAPEPAPPAPCWPDEPFLLRGKDEDKELSAGRFIPHLDGEQRDWFQGLLLWNGGSTSTSCSSRKPDPWSPSVQAATVDVICFYRCTGSGPTEAQVATLGKSVTSSRLQVTLPANVPMSLRLAARKDLPSSAACPAAKSYVDLPQSEPLLILLSDDGRQLLVHWELWSKQSPSGTPPRWASLPMAMHALVEAAWLEGKAKVAFTLPCQSEAGTLASSGSIENTDLAPGQYQITFGDDRRVQHTVKRLGPGGWQAKARRLVSTIEGEDARVSDTSADDQCVICMEKRRTHAFMHADTGDGHLAICKTCAENFLAERAAGSASQAFRTCPMCRRPFSALQRIYQ